MTAVYGQLSNPDALAVETVCEHIGENDQYCSIKVFSLMCLIDLELVMFL